MKPPKISEIQAFVESKGMTWKRIKVAKGEYIFAIGHTDAAGNFDEFIRARASSVFAIKKFFAYIMS